MEHKNEEIFEEISPIPSINFFGCKPGIAKNEYLGNGIMFLPCYMFIKHYPHFKFRDSFNIMTMNEV
jgi:hypothetical protein